MRIALGLTALLATATLAGCGSDVTKRFGFTRDAPDEFQVTTNPPLSMPPTLGQLPTPRPGVPRPQQQSERQQAEAILSPGVALQGAGTAAQPGAAEQALLAKAGPNVNNGIRTQVDDETARLNSRGPGLVDRMMFWHKQGQPGAVIDPAREAQRLQENAALGRSNDVGDTPIIEPQRRGFFSRIF